MAHGGPIIPVFLKAWQPIITPLSSVPYINSRLVLRDQRTQRLTTKSSYQWWSKHSISVLMPVSLSNPKAGLRDKAKPCGSPVSRPYCSWWSVWPALCTACSFLTDGRTNQAWCPTGGTLCIYRVRPGDGISLKCSWILMVVRATQNMMICGVKWRTAGFDPLYMQDWANWPPFIMWMCQCSRCTLRWISNQDVAVV